jgi:hypothetical protein
MSQLAYGSNGLVMTLSEQSDQVVLATKQKWQYATYTIVVEPSVASGIVTPAIMKNDDPSDEVDLEVTYRLSLACPLWWEVPDFSFAFFLNHSSSAESTTRSRQ